MLRLLFLVILACAGAFAPSRACARGAENRTWDFFPTVAESRQETAPQVAGLHQGNLVCGYDIASGCCLAAESRMTTVLGSGRDVAKYAGKEGFNVLDMSKVPQAEWARTNAEWLNKALRSGDDIWLVTDPAKHTQLMQQLGKQSYYLDLELPMLEQFGAKAVPKFVPATPP